MLFKIYVKPLGEGGHQEIGADRDVRRGPRTDLQNGWFYLQSPLLFKPEIEPAGQGARATASSQPNRLEASSSQAWKNGKGGLKKPTLHSPLHATAVCQHIELGVKAMEIQSTQRW